MIRYKVIYQGKENKKHWERGGFTREKDAWQYIKKVDLCPRCLKMLKDRREKRIAFTPCGRNWQIEEEYHDYNVVKKNEKKKS